jgi:3-phytase
MADIPFFMHPFRFASAAIICALPAQIWADPIRIATFNVALYRDAQGALARDLAAGDTQAQDIAAIIQAVSPDVILLNEFDYDPTALMVFNRQYLDGAYAYHFVAPSNTGLASGRDINGDGTITTRPGSMDYAGDAFGFGQFEGQYGMAILSRLPIDIEAARTFQTFLWADMPNARLPQTYGAMYYPPDVIAVFRLSSKTHWDIPILTEGGGIHILASHPTPPVFDGAEDRNGRRNADEIRFWADYIDNATYIYDDRGQFGGLPAGAHFVIAGDLNADPFDGDTYPGAIDQLLSHPQIAANPTPASAGGAHAARQQGGANASHMGDPLHDTADFRDTGRFGPGNLRGDYVLPSATLRIVDNGVFWPIQGPYADQIAASDHRLVWVDVVLPAEAQ